MLLIMFCQAYDTAEEVLERCESLALDIAGKPVSGVSSTLYTLRRNMAMGLDEALQREAEAQAHDFASPSTRDLIEKIATQI